MLAQKLAKEGSWSAALKIMPLHSVLSLGLVRLPNLAGLETAISGMNDLHDRGKAVTRLLHSHLAGAVTLDSELRTLAEETAKSMPEEVRRRWRIAKWQASSIS